MDLSKLGDTNPYQKFVNTSIHIIGCGSVGSTLAELLSRYGFLNFKLYDFDIVESKNLANQMYFDDDIATKKVDALEKILKRVNPEVRVTKFKDGYVNQTLNGFVFLCVDNIETRKEIVKSQKLNQNIKAMFDFRTLLYDAQHYACNWKNKTEVDNLLKTMDFSHEEAKQNTPVSACGIEIGEAGVIRMVVTLGVANFLNFCKGNEVSPLIMVSPYKYEVVAM